MNDVLKGQSICKRKRLMYLQKVAVFVKRLMFLKRFVFAKCWFWCVCKGGHLGGSSGSVRHCGRILGSGQVGQRLPFSVLNHCFLQRFSQEIVFFNNAHFDCLLKTLFCSRSLFIVFIVIVVFQVKRGSLDALLPCHGCRRPPVRTDFAHEGTWVSTEHI